MGDRRVDRRDEAEHHQPHGCGDRAHVPDREPRREQHRGPDHLRFEMEFPGVRFVLGALFVGLPIAHQHHDSRRPVQVRARFSDTS